MGWLEKELVLHTRNGEGDLIAIPYPIPELKNQKVLIIPLSRGELLELFATIRNIKESVSTEKGDKGISKKESDKQIKELWEDFVIKHIEKPKFKREDFKYMKLPPGPKFDKEKKKVVQKHVDMIDIFIDAIYAVSGIDKPEQIEEKIKKK